MIQQDIWDSNIHSELLGQKLITALSLKIVSEKNSPQDFPGGPEVKIPRSQCRDWVQSLLRQLDPTGCS